MARDPDYPCASTHTGADYFQDWLNEFPYDSFSKIISRSCFLIPNICSMIRTLICDTANGGGFHDCGNIIIKCIVLGLLFFSVFINDLCGSVDHSNNIKIYRTLKSP